MTTNFFAPILDGVTIPMPSTSNSTPYTIGTILITPTGYNRTQRHFTGEVIAFTWEKLSDSERNTLKGHINSAGYNPVTLQLTDGTTILNVIPNGFDVYTETKFEHFVANTVRWDVEMTWKEVPI